jgi:hypothetical protein
MLGTQKPGFLGGHEDIVRLQNKTNIFKTESIIQMAGK